jgi:inorganic pyrophosphatase
MNFFHNAPVADNRQFPARQCYALRLTGRSFIKGVPRFRRCIEGAIMRIEHIPTGDNPPESLNVLIEVPVGGEPVKYEFDKASGALFVDRILHTPMRYPANYGFVPHTLSPDGDPLDALVVARSPFIPGCVVRARPIAVLNLEDEHGGDEKLVCVPVDSTFPYYTAVNEKDDLPEILFSQIEHFFTHYKDLEKEKWVRVGTWGGADEARQIVLEAIERYEEAKKAGETPRAG